MWSPWSHCGIIDGDVVIEAIAVHGVVVTPLHEFLARSSRYAIVEFGAAYQPTIDAARAQIGTRYDYAGVAGIGLHHDWQDPSAWFCSELVAHALERGGLKLFRSDAGRITPQHLWMIETPLLNAA